MHSPTVLLLLAEPTLGRRLPPHRRRTWLTRSAVQSEESGAGGRERAGSIFFCRAVSVVAGSAGFRHSMEYLLYLADQRLRPMNAPKQDTPVSAAYKPARAPNVRFKVRVVRLASPKQSDPANKANTTIPPNRSPHRSGAQPARREHTKPPHITVSPRTDSPSGVRTRSGSGRAQSVPAAIRSRMSPMTAATGSANRALRRERRRLDRKSVV